MFACRSARFWGSRTARTAVRCEGGRSVGAAGPRRHRAPRLASAHLGGLRRRPSPTRSGRRSRSTATAGTRSIRERSCSPAASTANVGCSGSWLAHHEYVVEDVNKWSFLAHSGRIAGATSIDTHGDLSRSTRHRSHEAYGFGDELRVSLVVDGDLLGSGGLPPPRRPALVHRGRRAERWSRWRRPSPPACAGRCSSPPASPWPVGPVDHGPGVVVFDAHGEPESISGCRGALDRRAGRGPAAGPAERVEDRAGGRRPRPVDPARHRPARAGRPSPGAHPHRHLAAAVRHPAQRRTPGRTAVIIHPATPQDVAPVIALSYGLTDRECQVAMQCIQGRATKEIARALVHVAVHRAGSPQVDLRQDRRAQPRRAGRTDLPRPLRDPLGSTGTTAPPGLLVLSINTSSPPTETRSAASS